MQVYGRFFASVTIVKGTLTTGESARLRIFMPPLQDSACRFSWTRLRVRPFPMWSKVCQEWGKTQLSTGRQFRIRVVAPDQSVAPSLALPCRKR